MVRPMDTLQQVVQMAVEVDTQAALARHCGVKPQTVDGWTREGLPWHHAQAVREYLHAHGVEVSAEQLEALAALRRGGVRRAEGGAQFSSVADKARRTKKHPLEGAQ